MRSKANVISTFLLFHNLDTSRLIFKGFMASPTHWLRFVMQIHDAETNSHVSLGDPRD